MLKLNHASNHLLASLAPAEFDDLLPHLKFTDLPRETVLFESGDTIRAVYFPHDGVVSLVVGLSTGEMIEAAMIGNDGVAGGSSAFGNNISLCRAVVQIAGHASVLGVDRFCALADKSTPFRALVNNHEHFLLAQAQQSAACNASHALEARLARWLLRCRDLMHSDDIALTQEFLAEMLGVRRTSVSLVAGTLQQAGLIRYRRGHIRILDVETLKDSACECYATLKAHSDRLLGAPKG
jgi:CRP-like cAMP-binding protein